MTDPHPKPEVPARVATDDEIPTGAKRLARVAEESGWSVVTTYARGATPGRTSRVVDSVALRMSQGPRRGWAVYEDGKFHSAHVWGSGLPITKHNVTTMRAELEKQMSFDWGSITPGDPNKVPRDEKDRPMIVPPGGNRMVPYARVTNFAATLEDRYNIGLWQQRMVALGLSERPDLMLSIAAHRDDKKQLNDICESAIEAAKAGAAATVGTALHKLTDKIDRGEDLGTIPVEYQADLEAFRRETAKLEVVAIEKFVVQDDLQCGGTFDRLYRYRGKLYIGDTKSGNIDLGAGKIASQLSVYAHSVGYNPNGAVREHLGDIDLDRAIIVHLPAGTGTCQLRWLDIRSGWDAAQRLAVEVRQWRNRKDLHWPFDDLDAAVEVITERLGGEIVPLADQLMTLVETADSPAALETLWAEHKAEWTSEHTGAARRRKTFLHGRSLRKVG